jgi:DNA-binding MarR family transcriptional regulator
LGLHDTTSNNANKLSIDDAIIDYLSEKGIIDQTEKLALARIASKMETTIDQVQTSINRLSAKNLVRKIYVQSKIGFELTPRGKSAIEVLAKAQTDRVTKQLQEAIHQERKANLRTNNINKTKSIADRWQNYQVPERRLMDEIAQETSKLLKATKETESKQPLCNIDPRNYDQEFAQYKLQVENLNQKNSNLTRSVNNYAKIEEYQLSVSDDIEKISKTIIKYEPVAEATEQIRQLQTALNQLKTIQSQLENFDKKQLCQFEELKTRLADNSRLLENLKKSTHEFTPVNRENSARKPTLYADPEGPIKYESKKRIYPLEEKCSKCGTKRKLTQVDIG